MIGELVQGIKESWDGSIDKINISVGTVDSKGIFRVRGNIVRKSRINRFRNSLRLNNSTKNRSIRSIKTANHIAKGIHFKDCPDNC